MGASQSKKRRKEKRKRKRLCPVHEIPRSASVDVIRTMNVSTTLSSCPHCLHSLSWSEYVGEDCKHSPYRHRCLHGQYEEMRVGGAGCESCPDCYSISHQRQTRRHGESPSSFPAMSSLGGRTEYSTMSLNRNVHHLTSIKPRNDHSKDLEFSQLLEILERQKDRKGLQQGDALSQRSLVSPREKMASYMTSASVSSFSPFSPKPLPSHPSSLSSAQSATDNQSFGSRDNKTVVLDDEELKVSQWIKRKQMAQQLRDLRKHLEEEQSSELNVLSHSTRNEDILNDDDSDMQRAQLMEDTEQLDPAPLADASSGDALADTPSPTRRSARSKFSRMSNYRFLDNHPVMTKLQNEQNNRLESMERRMKEIRISAMQEAERRKFAEIFPAKNDDSETQRMLEEAKETLEKLKEEKRRKIQSLQGHQPTQGHQEEPVQLLLEDESRVSEGSALTPHDSGDIIPVCVVPRRDAGSSQAKLKGVVELSDKSKEVDNKDKPFWLKNDWPEINLNQPLTWLLLPFLLFPLILRMLLSLIINTSTTALCDRTAGNNTSSSEDRNGRRSSDGNPGLSRLGSKKFR